MDIDMSMDIDTSPAGPCVGENGGASGTPAGSS